LGSAELRLTRTVTALTARWLQPSGTVAQVAKVLVDSSITVIETSAFLGEKTRALPGFPVSKASATQKSKVPIRDLSPIIQPEYHLRNP
jgi:hypothetical protein